MCPLLILWLLNGQASPPATDPDPPGPQLAPRDPNLDPRFGADAAAQPGEPSAIPTSTAFAPPLADGLEGTFCDSDRSPCAAGEAQVLLGAGSSNFGGFGLGLSLSTEIFDASPAALQSHVQLRLEGHFNGIGTPQPGPRPPRGELDAAGTVGLGVMGKAAFRSGVSPFAFVHPVAFEAGNLAGAEVYAYQPTLEVGVLAHSAALGGSLILSLRGGGDFFYANHSLSLLNADGSLQRWRSAPFAVGELVWVQRLSAALGLHLGGQLQDTPEPLGDGSWRHLLRGRFWAYLRLGGLMTGPFFTLTAPGKQPDPLGAGSYVRAPPETAFLWMLGI